MSQKSSNKKTKIAIAVGVAVVLAGAGWAFGTMSISNKFNSNLETYVQNANDTIQNSEAWFIKPIFKVEDIKSSFNTSEFTIAVEIKNERKKSAQANIDYMEKELKSDPEGYYTQEMIDEEKAKLKAMPDTTRLMTIKNVAKHGPLPLISSFNFKPGLTHIQSTVHHENLQPDTQMLLKELLDEETSKALQAHVFLTANSFVGFSADLDSQIAIPTFTIKPIGSASTVFNFGGIDLNLQTASSFDNINFSGALNKTTLTDTKGNLDFGGINFAIDAKNLNDFALFNSSFNFLPLAVNMSVADTPSKINYGGFAYTYERKHNADNVTFDESVSVVSKPLATDITSYDWMSGQNTNSKIDISEMKMDFLGKKLPKEFYEQYAIYSAKQLAPIKDLLKGDFAALVNGPNEAEYILTALDLYRSIAGDISATVAPFNISIVESTKEAPISSFNAQIDAVKLGINREALANDKPLNLDFTISGLNIEVNEPEDNVTKFNMKDLSLGYAIPLFNLYPIAINNKIGSIDFNQTNLTAFSLKNLALNSALNNEGNKLSYTEHYKLDNFDLLGANLGGFEVKANMSNLNLEGLTMIETGLKQAFANYDKKFLEHKDTFGSANLAEEIKSVFESREQEFLSTFTKDGVVFTLSPVVLKSEAGQAKLDLDITTHPLMSALESADPVSLIYSVVNKMNFNLDADISYLSDIAAKGTLLQAAIETNTAINTSELDAQKKQFKDMIGMFSNMPPISEFIKVENDKLKSTISFSDKQLNINGTPRTIEEIMQNLM